MAKKKRASSRSKFLNRAVKAGRSYLREAERRLPPDVRRQIDRSIKDGQKTVHGDPGPVPARTGRLAQGAEYRDSAQEHRAGAQPGPFRAWPCQGVAVIDLKIGQQAWFERALDPFLEARVSAAGCVSPERRQLADAVDPVIDRGGDAGPWVWVFQHR